MLIFGQGSLVVSASCLDLFGEWFELFGRWLRVFSLDKKDLFDIWEVVGSFFPCQKGIV